MKRIFLFLLLIIASIQLFSQNAVTVSNTNLRESPGVSTKIVSKIPKGTDVYIQECTDGWCKINYNDLTGYVSSKLIRYATDPSKKTTNSPVAHQKVKHYTNSNGERIQSPTYYNAIPEGATAVCQDGTYSFSRNRRGTCSHHGGVKKWL
jgi:uncharacterized protein YgiM (DUF1202 family)